jgi:predicted ABC-type ATPase
VTTPTLTFIAGANGSGKTTLTRWNSDLFREIPLLDPDAVANTLQATVSEFLPMAAARHVLKTARKHLEQCESFAIETTLSGKNYLQVMRDARNRGFEILLVYIGTADVEINLARIRNRVLAGSFENLPMAIKRADHAILFDNSTENGYRLLAILSSVENQWFEPKPAWVTFAI